MTLRMQIGMGVFACALAIAAFAGGAARADSDDIAHQWLSTGQRLTPEAAAGALFQELDPGFKDAPGIRAGMAVTTAVSHDGKTLLILTSGFNVWTDPSGQKPGHIAQYVFVYDISGRTPQMRQVLQIVNTDSGIVFAPDDSRFYVSGGADDVVHVFAQTNGTWAEDGKPIALGHK